MLQWMGGSRRKVTTSTKSTQKRQKQYFEQRKRQQQHQQAARVEHVPDEEKRCPEQNNNNRSLDVLSLLNLSTVTREGNSCHATEGGIFSRGDQSTQSSPATQTNEVKHIAFQPMEARMSPCHVAATTHRIKEPINALGCQDKFMENHETENNLKSITGHQLSVIDLVGDGPSSKSEEVSAREAHVAFSIKGLGKVVAETPVHSPERHVRTLSYGFASPSKAKRHARVDFSGGLNAVDPEQDSMWDINLPLHAGLMEQPFRSKSPGEYRINGKSTFSASKNLRQPNINNINLMDSYGGSNSFLPNIPDEEEYSLSFETGVDQKKGCFVDYLNIRDPGREGFTFEGYYPDNSRRDFDATGRSNFLDIPDIYCQPFSSESQSNCNMADEIWTSKLEGVSGFSQAGNDTTCPYFNNEDAVESFRSWSEQGGKTTSNKERYSRDNRSLFNEGRKYGSRIFNREAKSPLSAEIEFANKERYSRDNRSLFNEGRKYGSRIFNREAKSPLSAKIEFPNNKRLSRTDYDDLEIPNFNPFYHSPDTELMSPDANLWTEDMWFSSPDLHSDTGFRSTSRKSFASTYAPCSKSLLEEYNFCQPFSDMKSHDNILPDTASGNSKPKLCKDSKKYNQDVLDVIDCLGSAESSDTIGDEDETSRSLINNKGKYDLWSSEFNMHQDSMKGQRDWNPLDDVSFLRSGKSSNQDLGKNTCSFPITNEKFDRQDISGSNSFVVGNSSNTSRFEGRSSKYKSSTCRSPEKDSLKELETELDAEDKASAAEVSDISDDTESIPYKTECKQDPEAPVPCQDKREEPEDSGIGGKNVAKTASVHPTCQEVLLIEGCVLQLLRVQVVKDVSPDISQKKISLLNRSTSS